MPLLDTQAAAIIAATREVAAAEIMPRFRNLGAGEVDTKAAFDDLVTVADVAAEAALTKRIAEILPGDTVIGEEAVAGYPKLLDRVGEGRVVIIDPVDGTWNFAHGNANFGVILAVVEEGETVWGLLYDPSFDDWVVTSRGGGTWFHRGDSKRRLALEPGPVPQDRLRATFAEYYFPQALRPGLARVMPRFARVSSVGASVHEYRGLVLGASDMVVNAGIKPWDHAAGALALEEAGGVVRLVDGTPYGPMIRRGYPLAARSETVWDQVAPIFAEALG